MAHRYQYEQSAQQTNDTCRGFQLFSEKKNTIRCEFLFATVSHIDKKAFCVLFFPQGKHLHPRICLRYWISSSG